MITKGEEKRKSRRIFFSKEDQIVAHIIFPETKDRPVEANVMNLSEGGICVTYEKDESLKVNKGEILHMTHLIGIKPELSVDAHNIEVRWIMNEKSFKHDQIGCKFIDPSDELREKVKRLHVSMSR